MKYLPPAAILAVALPFASLSAEPLRIADNPFRSCAAFLNMNDHDQQLYGAGFFAALSQGYALTFYAVLTTRTFADDLRKYCERNRGANMQDIAYKIDWNIYLRAPTPVDEPPVCDTCE